MMTETLGASRAASDVPRQRAAQIAATRAGVQNFFRIEPGKRDC